MVATTVWDAAEEQWLVPQDNLPDFERPRDKWSGVKIVSISPYLPYPGISHAGGEYYRRHATLVSDCHDVLILSPHTPENEAAMEAEREAPYRRGLIAPTIRRRPGGRWTHALINRVAPFMAVGAFRKALLTNPAARLELESADRIELQWFDSIVMAPRLRSAFPRTPIIGVFHDVVSQGHRRTMLAPTVRLKARILALMRLLLAIPLERRVMAVMDTAVVLSDKDRKLLARRKGAAQIVVVAPPLDDDGMPSGPRAEPPIAPEVLFVGALWRVENEDAALWLLNDIWPRVRSAIPGVKLTLAGAGPSQRVQKAAARYDDVEVTSYVQSLAPYYERASVAVAPMRLGAGVKLKTVTAMLWSVPVIATSIAAEGIAGPGMFAAIVDQGPAFSEAVIAVLRAPRSTSEVCARAYIWSHETFSTDRYIDCLSSLYR